LPIPATPSSSTAPGSIYVRPSSEIESAYAERVCARRQAHSALRDLPCKTKDGWWSNSINAGSSLTCRRGHRSAGIGLFRTELQFMVSPRLPRSSDQLALYRTSRCRRRQTGDLPHPRYRRRQGAALYGDGDRGVSGAGWRAIRFGLDRPGLLRGQIRAAAPAAAGR
jgi:phosphotransferase system enzyme I (PtsP)